MGGGLMQLVAYGAQDIYLTGNPQITFFKVVYRRHTNFSMECIQQTWNGSNLTNGRCTATISRNGDLVHRMHIEVQGTTAAAGHNNPGSAWIDDVKLEIGGQEVDKQSGVWMETWAELTQPNPTGRVGTHADNNTQSNTSTTLFQNSAGHGGLRSAADAARFNVPLQFWFCRNAGLSLPLIALQYHEVKINLEFREARQCYWGTGRFANEVPQLRAASLYVDYIYLDTEERRRFAQQSHEYLIDQVQYTGAVSRSSVDAGQTQSLRLDFNHPCKELVWVERALTANAGLCNFDTNLGKQGGSALLQLNGHDRFAKRPMNYFTRVQPLQHHTNVPFGDRIGVYSFGLRPEDHQPSGTCNFSRIDNATLQLTLAHPNGQTNEFQVYATNYNVLRIMSGMGGLAYSN